jgi:hypothetical protein
MICGEVQQHRALDGADHVQKQVQFVVVNLPAFGE